VSSIAQIPPKQMSAIRMLEEISFNAHPAFHTLHYDGWLLRFANGYTKRANSVNPIYPSTLPLADKIAYCEQVYAEQELPTIFKLTDATQPAELDETLSTYGYKRASLVSVQVLNLSRVDKTPTFTDVWVDTAFKGEWLLTLARLRETDEEHIPNVALMVASIIPQTCFMTLHLGREAIATGVGVLERGWLGLFEVVVAREFRRQGLGRQLMLHMIAWGKRNGAQMAYLQVETSNVPALNLYHGLGFREAYRYWYRMR
jgi:N-acetylglutamate synthase